MARTLLVVPTARRLGRGQDVPGPGAGARPARRERRLRQAGEPSPGPTAARTARPRWSRPYLRCAPPNHCPPPELEQQLGEGGVDACLRRPSLPGSRSITDPTLSSSRASTRARPSSTPTKSTRRWPEHSTPMCWWSAAGRRQTRAARPGSRDGARPRGHHRRPGRDALHHRERIPVRRAGARGRLRDRRPAGGGSLSGAAAGRGAVPDGLRLLAAVQRRPELALAAGTRPGTRAGPAGSLRRRPVPAHQGRGSVRPGRPRRPARAHRGPARRRPRRPPRGGHGRLPRRAQRDPAGRAAPVRRDRAGSAGLGAHPGRVRHRPARPGRRRRQLRDRDPGARRRPRAAGRRPGADRQSGH